MGGEVHVGWRGGSRERVDAREEVEGMPQASTDHISKEKGRGAGRGAGQGRTYYWMGHCLTRSFSWVR